MTKKKSAVKKAVAKKKAAPKAERKNKIARQSRLPGMEDTKIKLLEDTALDYKEMRDERQRIGRDEVTLKNRLLELMHKEKKTEYHRNGISIKVLVEKESVKVKVKAEGEAEDTAEAIETEVEVTEAEYVEEVAS